MAHGLPPGFRPLLIADTRRARAWEADLRRAGFEVVLEETSGADADAGAWQLGVRESQEAEAKRFVSEVMQGKRTLRGRGLGWKGAVVILVLAAFLLTIFWTGT